MERRLMQFSKSIRTLPLIKYIGRFWTQRLFINGTVKNIGCHKKNKLASTCIVCEIYTQVHFRTNPEEFIEKTKEWVYMWKHNRTRPDVKDTCVYSGPTRLSVMLASKDQDDVTKTDPLYLQKQPCPSCFPWNLCCDSCILQRSVSISRDLKQFLLA